MSTCFFGHKWNGCVCTRCGKKRDEGHVLQGCECTICGKKIHNGKDCTCTRCKATRDMFHKFEKCRCTVCGKTRDEQHDWDRCKCTICGKIGAKQHVWDHCKCITCGATRHTHLWVNGYCNKCKISIEDHFGWVSEGMKEKAVRAHLGPPDVEMSDSEMYEMMGSVIFSSGSAPSNGFTWRYRQGGKVCDIYFRCPANLRVFGGRVQSVKVQ